MVDRKTIALVWLATAALVLATAAGAAERARGSGLLRDKDLVQRTVTIDDGVYRVVDGTVIEDLDGDELTLEDLPLTDTQLPEFMVEFETTEKGLDRVLSLLRLTEVTH